MVGFKKSKRSKDVAKDPPSGLVGEQSRLEESSGEPQSQQAELSPPTVSRTRRILGKLKGKSRSPSLSPGVEIGRHNSRMNLPLPTSVSQLLTVPESALARPHSSHSSHSSYSGRSTLHTYEPSLHEPLSLTGGGNIPAMPPGDHSTYSGTQGLCHVSASAPIIHVSGSQSEPIPSSGVWCKALEIAERNLIDKNLPSLDLMTLTSQPAEENIASVTEALEALYEDDKNKWSGTWRGKKSIEYLGKILRVAYKYSHVTTAVVTAATRLTANPELGALIWASVLAIMQVALHHVEFIEGFEEAIAMLVEKIAICDFYAEIYIEIALPSRSTDNSLRLQRMLDSALPELYAAVIVFSVKARSYFQGRGMTKFVMTLKSFEVEIQPFIKDMNEKEGFIREYADAATMERVRNIKSDIEDIMLELNDTSAKATQILKVTGEIRDKTVVELLQVLTPLEPLKRHQDIKLLGSTNAGTWLLKNESFSKWRESNVLEESERVFLCYGIPGAGKTVISSAVIDDLRSLRAGNIGVACLYADYKDQTDQTLVHILGSFLHQFLTTTREPIPDEIVDTLQDIQRQRAKFGAQDILSILTIWLHQLQRAFICIDAIDELQPRVRRQLLDKLKGLSTGNTRLFLTGRGHIRSEVQQYFQVAQRHIVEIRANHQDIQEFVKQQISEDNELGSEAMDEVLEKEIVDTIVEKSQGMFLLPALHIKMVLGMPTKSKRREALKTLPTDLSDSFQGIITRIRECTDVGQAELGIRVLQWLHFACRPLKLVELQHALAVEESHKEFDVDNIPSQKTLLDCCLGLVLVDEKTLTVRFVHYTLEEHFQDYARAEFPNGSSYIARTCLTYLNFGKLSSHFTSLDNLRENIEKNEFLSYAALHWGTHVKQQGSGDLTELSKTIVDHESERPPCGIQTLYLELDKRWSSSERPIAQKFSGIHVMAYFGLVENMSSFCKIEEHKELKDDTGRTPLSWAAEYGNEATVQMLIDRNDVDINSTDNIYGRTPLMWAAGKGHEAVVQQLVKREDVDIHAKNKDGLTALLWAAFWGHEAVVRVLIERSDVDINAVDEEGRTPFSCAAQKGHIAVMRLLIERDDFDIHATNEDGRTPLLWAAWTGNNIVVLLLIERDDVDINTQDRDGRTPLLLATWSGKIDIVRLLIRRSDVDINAKDRDGRTAFSWAAWKGNEAIVKLLIQRDDVDINAEDMDGQKPLLLAARVGHEAVVRLLINRDDVDINTRDKDGRTPLLWAARLGKEAAVRLLIEKHDIDINAQDKDGRTPLSEATKEGHKVIVGLLTERDDIDINTKDKSGRTPLSHAAEKGNEAVVRLLIERNDIDINANDKGGRTPLSRAAEEGHEAIVRLLVERDDVDVNTKDIHEWTPLFWATWKRNETIVQLLITRDDIDINVQDRNGRTPLSYAAEDGQKVVVWLLIKKDNVDINSTDNKYGKSPLVWAAGRGHEEVVRQLMERNIDINVKDRGGQTPLSHAAEKGHVAVVLLLIERNDIDINVNDRGGRTPLLQAAEKGREAVVRLLVERDDVDINARDIGGWTPLLWAAAEGHESVVRLLIERGDVHINAKDCDGWTPLFWAARKAHGAIVQLLIEKDSIDINAQDNNGRTLLSQAAEDGQEVVVRLLLERDNVDINSTDHKYGKPPLTWAAGKGHEAVVRLLTERDDIDINIKDRGGRTPLFWASWIGNEAVVRLLVEKNGVDVNAEDKDRLTALSVAAKEGYVEIVRLLVEREDVEVNAQDCNGLTPLFWAALKGNEAVVRLLVEIDEVDISIEEVHGLTPLSVAASEGHEAIVQLLSGRRDVQT